MLEERGFCGMPDVYGPPDACVIHQYLGSTSVYLAINPSRDRGDRWSSPFAQAAEVGIPDGERRMGQYPYQLSGGLLQRVMIAAALLAEPRLIIGDEPTTVLDVTIQEEVMAILSELRSERGLAMILITHDLARRSQA